MTIDNIARGLALKAQKYSGGNNPIVATRCSAYNQGLSNGTDTGVTYRVQHVSPNGGADIQLVYGNFYGIGDTPGVNNITVKASIEIGGTSSTSGTCYPVTFDGQSTVTIVPGGMVVSDPVGVELAAGSTFYTRTYVSVTSGQKWPLGITSWTANGEGKTTGDITGGGAFTTSFEFCYSPLAIIGTTNPVWQPSVLLIGDSIMYGQGSTSGHDSGFAVYAINNNLPYIGMGFPGERADQYQGTGRQWRIRVAKFASYAIVEYGVNDLNYNSAVTPSYIQTQLLNIWNALAQRGLKVYQTTITPRTTSTDNWATTQNQTPFSAAFGPGTCTRTIVNDWIRSVPAPLSGYFDTADQVETSRNSGIWIPNTTVDGLHPNEAGHQLMKNAIDISQFV
jgi:lysophospholipase L1-like esterase